MYLNLPADCWIKWSDTPTIEFPNDVVCQMELDSQYKMVIFDVHWQKMIDLQIAFAGLREMWCTSKICKKATFEVTSQEMFDCKTISPILIVIWIYLVI